MSEGLGLSPERNMPKERSQLTKNHSEGNWTQAGKAQLKQKANENAILETNIQGVPSQRIDSLFSLMSLEEQTTMYAPKTYDYKPGDWLKKELSRSLWEHNEPKPALKETFSKKIEGQDITGNVTAYLQNDKLFVANRGNFQAVLGKEGYAESLTEYVPPEEEVKVTEHTLPQGESQLIMGSAGLWNFMTPEEATKLIAQVKNPEEASILLRQEAYKRAQLKDGTVGDISVMVVNLNVPEKGVTSLSDRRTRKATRPYGRMAA